MLQFQQSSDHHTRSSETRLALLELESGGWAFYIHEDLSLDMCNPEDRGVTLVRWCSLADEGG